MIRNKTGQLLYGDLSERIIKLCYEVHFQYGSGHKESVYQNALAEKMKIEGLNFEKEVGIEIKSIDTGKKLGNQRLDFVVENKIVLELKAIKFTPIKLEQQLYSYLRNSSHKVGLMINSGSTKLFLRRIILTG